MALQPTIMGDGDTAEHAMVAGAEAVDVKT
jgi:hypothetical protein